MSKKKVIIICVLAVIIIGTILSFCIIKFKNKDDIDVYINTNYFITKIQRILNDEANYNNKTVSISGYVHYDEEGRIFIARDGITSSGKKMFGLMLQGNFGNFDEGTWVKIKGKIKYMISDYTSNSKVPYIYVEIMSQTKEHEDDRIVVN